MKILVIENDFISRNYLRDLFNYSGYQCVTAQNASDGLDVYLSEKPDVIICNMLLPGMSGLELLNTIRKKDSKTSIIIATTKSSENIAIQAFRLGATDFLKKPIQDKDILPILEKLKEKHQAEPQDIKYGDVEQGSMKFTFRTELDSVHLIVERLIGELGDDFFDEDDKINIELGLIELITNALEHGNLNISFDEKTAACDNNTLEELLESRMKDPTYSNRLITVNFEYTPEECIWSIIDEGDGFDISQLPDPTAKENLDSLHGRGIFMTKLFFDSLEYKGKGNQAVAIKRRKFLL